MYKFMILLLAISPYVQAEVYKCKPSVEKTIYQSTPCPLATAQSVVEIKDLDAEQLEKAQLEFTSWQQQLEAKKAADEVLKKEQQKARQEQAVVDALRRSALAQEQQVKIDQYRARIAEQNTQVYPQGISIGFIPAPYFPYPSPLLPWQYPGYAPKPVIPATPISTQPTTGGLIIPKQ